MQVAYRRLHALGHAHSFEVFDGDRLVGGIYGVAVGRMFFGESMFSAESGGSKVALAALARHLHAWGWPLIDAQVENAHLMSLGAQPWPRRRFVAEVAALAAQPALPEPWTERSATGRRVCWRAHCPINRFFATAPSTWQNAGLRSVPHPEARAAPRISGTTWQKTT